MSSSFDRLAASGPGGLAQELTLPELSSFGVTSSAPMTVVGGASVAMFALGLPATPLFFVAVGVVLGIWVIGYAALSQHVRSAGAQAAFITRGLGRIPGVAAQGVALVSYGAIYLCLYGLLGTVATPVVTRWTGLHPAWWQCALIAAIGVGLLGRTRVKIAGRVLTWLLAAEILAVVMVDVAGFTHPASGHLNLADLNPTALWHHGWTGVGGVLAYAVACYVGCEETPGLAEDARNGHRDVRRALLIAVAFLGVFYTVSFLALSTGEGPGDIASVAADPTSGFPFDLVTHAYGSAGSTLADIANLLLVTSVFAALASFHTVCVRYVYAAGRDRVIPARLGRVNPRNSSPSAASHLVSAVALGVILLTRLTHTDPFLGLFAWGSYVAAVGILALMICSSIAVIGYFHRHTIASSRLATAVMPVVAAVLMAGLWVLMLTSPQTMIGAPLFGRVHLTLLALPVTGLVAGLMRALVIRRQPDTDTWSRVGQPTPVEQPAAPIGQPVYTDVSL